MRPSASRAIAGLTLVEILISTAISGTLMAVLFSAAISMQRSFIATEDYAVAKTDQARLSDYIALDLRRALALTPGTDGSTIMTVKIPDYYNGEGKPRTPTITRYVANYGDPALPVTVVYKKIGSSIYRQQNTDPAREIASNVEDFQLTVADLGKVVKTQITFAPRFSRVPSTAARTATTVFSTTLLRNKRKNL